MSEIRVEDFHFEARDGLRLAATAVEPERPRGALLVSSATGYPRGFYRRFAEASARRGWAVTLYDYRGIGGSAPDDLAAMRMDYTDWGRLDMAAAFDDLARRHPTGPRRHVGHSAGGHFLGFADSHGVADRHAFVAVGSGYWAKHHLANRPLELFFWWGLGPFRLATKGYVPTGLGWTGAPLPRGVFTTWRRWCAKPDYFASELESRLRPHWFEAVEAPIRSFVFPDDPIATPQTGADMLAVYPNAPSTLVVRAPRDLGLARVGHDGAFRKQAAPFWPELWAWLEEGLEAFGEATSEGP